MVNPVKYFTNNIIQVNYKNYIKYWQIKCK